MGQEGVGELRAENCAPSELRAERIAPTHPRSSSGSFRSPKLETICTIPYGTLRPTRRMPFCRAYEKILAYWLMSYPHVFRHFTRFLSSEKEPPPSAPPPKTNASSAGWCWR